MGRTIVLVDGMNGAHRGAHSYSGLSTKDGKPTGAVFGMLSGLFSLGKHIKNEYRMIVFWEGGAPDPRYKKVKSWRHSLYKEYKAGRVKNQTTVDAQSQVPALVEAFNCLRIPQVYVPGIEADDLIGITSAKLEGDPSVDRVLIYSTDKDFFQCTSDKTSILRMYGGKSEFVTPKSVIEQYQVRHDLFAEYKALVGDSSDHYFGAGGVGPATACKMIAAGVRPSIRVWEDHPEEVLAQFPKLATVWDTVHTCYKLAYIPRSSTYKLLPKDYRSLIKAGVASAIKEATRAPSRTAYNQALSDWTRFCSEKEFSTFLADRRKHLRHLTCP